MSPTRVAIMLLSEITDVHRDIDVLLKEAHTSIGQLHAYPDVRKSVLKFHDDRQNVGSAQNHGTDCRVGDCADSCTMHAYETKRGIYSKIDGSSAIPLSSRARSRPCADRNRR
jgi:hypothetical protein